MLCRVTRGHFGRVLVMADGGWSAVFEPGRRTLTAAKHRNGELRSCTAATILDYLGVERNLLKKPYDHVDVDDRGVFGELSPVDISQHAKWVFNIISQPARTLMGACALEMKKERS